MKNKKSIYAAILGILFCLLSLRVFADTLVNNRCELKRLAIERELDYARTYNNTNRVLGLEMALAQVNMDCQNSQEKVVINAGENPWGDSCDAKRNAIERELPYAREQDNTHRVSGLEKALAEVNTNCSDASIRSDLEKKVLDAEDEVRRREEDLRKAQAKGDRKKIVRRQKKLEQAQTELELMRVRLQALKK